MVVKQKGNKIMNKIIKYKDKINKHKCLSHLLHQQVN